MKGKDLVVEEIFGLLINMCKEMELGKEKRRNWRWKKK
jgi:hypothetical protein